jgi:hypothetical protein
LGVKDDQELRSLRKLSLREHTYHNKFWTHDAFTQWHGLEHAGSFHSSGFVWTRMKHSCIGIVNAIFEKQLYHNTNVHNISSWTPHGSNQIDTVRAACTFCLDSLWKCIAYVSHTCVLIYVVLQSSTRFSVCCWPWWAVFSLLLTFRKPCCVSGPLQTSLHPKSRIGNKSMKLRTESLDKYGEAGSSLIRKQHL